MPSPALWLTVCFAALGQARAQHSVAPEQSEIITQLQQKISAGDLAGAKSQALELLQKHPADANLLNLLGVVDADQAEVLPAAEYFRSALAANPGLVAAALNLARLYLEHPQTFPDAEDQARSLYTRVLAGSPHEAEANAELALIEERHAEYRSVLRHVAAMPTGSSTSALEQSLRCGAYAGLQEHGEANTWCSNLARNPRLTEADVMTAAEGLRDGRRADLLSKLLSTSQQRQPLSPAGARLLGLAQDAAGDSESARSTLEQAYATAPQDGQLLLDLAAVAHHEGKYQQELGYLAHARELQPANPDLQSRFAEACISLGLLGEARNAMEKAIALSPDNADYLLTMAKVTALSQDPLSAKPFLDRYHALKPDDPQGILLLGVIEYRVKDFAAARPWLVMASATPATAAQADFYLGSGARQEGKLPEAQQLLERSAKEDPKDAEVHAELGLLALQRHDNDQAATQLQQALSLNPNSYTGNYGLLQLYAHTADPRRPEQLKRFEALKDQNESLNRQAMRVLEIRPELSSAPAH